MRKPSQIHAQQAPQRQPLLFVYGRFSSAPQAAGDSLRRQMDAARAWAAQHGYAVDDKLTMFDHGLSAFDGTNATAGALGAFLNAIRSKEKLVQPGDVLWVESLDRLSRAEELEALGQFSTIVQAGVTIVTDRDGIYSRELIRQSPGSLHGALAVMTRAHNESAHKSDRSRAALYGKVKAWNEEGRRDVRLTAGRDPEWVTYDAEKKKFVLVPAHAKAIRTLIKYFKAGHSPMRSLEMLTAAGLMPPARLTRDGKPVTGISNSSRVYQLFGNRMLVGERPVDIDGKTHILVDYYPALIGEGDFAELQHLRTQRGRRPGKGTIPSILTGMRLCYCGVCGKAMGAQNLKGTNLRDDGLPQNGNRRLQCTGALKVPKCRSGSCSIVPIEYALVDYCSDQINLDALLGAQIAGTTLAAELVAARDELARLDQEGKNTMDQIAKQGGRGRFAGARLDEIEARMDELEKDIARLQREQITLAVTDTAAVAAQWINIKEGVHALDRDARMKARNLMLDTFSKIKVYIGGVSGDVTAVVDMLLQSRQGVQRFLRIDRKTGELIQVTDIDTPMLEVD
ncbi:DNA invertase Pin-like site-specific DNA recombinase [Paraburkholderia atlantica]|uniref:recombinase family protein n=1 Tax=Paraburkholderia atlantica TaxID=2654982 RepID=UPI003D1C1300